MAKMKNHDCPLGVSYVAIKAEKSKRKVDWVSMVYLIVDFIMGINGIDNGRSSTGSMGAD